MGRPKKVAVHPLELLNTKTNKPRMDLVKRLLQEGNGQFAFADLIKGCGNLRAARGAIWVARYSGIKLNAIRIGRKIDSYINTATLVAPQTKNVPKEFKSYWKNKKHQTIETPVLASSV